MAANTQPIFALTPNVTVGNSLSTANTALDGTGTVATIYTAGVNGSRLDYIKVKNTGTAVATVLRLFMNNGGVNSNVANNTLFYELSIAANTVTQTAASTDYMISLGISLPPGYKILATIGTTVATPIVMSAVGGDY